MWPQNITLRRWLDVLYNLLLFYDSLLTFNCVKRTNCRNGETLDLAYTSPKYCDSILSQTRLEIKSIPLIFVTILIIGNYHKSVDNHMCFLSPISGWERFMRKQKLAFYYAYYLGIGYIARNTPPHRRCHSATPSSLSYLRPWSLSKSMASKIWQSSIYI